MPCAVRKRASRNRRRRIARRWMRHRRAKPTATTPHHPVAARFEHAMPISVACASRASPPYRYCHACAGWRARNPPLPPRPRPATQFSHSFDSTSAPANAGIVSPSRSRCAQLMIGKPGRAACLRDVARRFQSNSTTPAATDTFSDEVFPPRNPHQHIACRHLVATCLGAERYTARRHNRHVVV